MSRGMTPAILAMLDERARDKLRCVLELRARGSVLKDAPVPAGLAPGLPGRSGLRAS